MGRSGSSGDVRVSIGAEVSDLRRGMNEAGGLVKEFKERAERGGGSVRYLSEAFTALSGASGNAGKALGLFSGALAGFAAGGVAGAAFAAVGGLVQIFKEMREESGKATDKIKEGIKGAREEAEKATLKLERMNYVAAGGDGRMFDALHNTAAFVDERSKLQVKEAEILERKLKLEAELADLQARGRKGWADSTKRKVEEADADLAAQRAKIAGLEKERQAVLDLAKAETEEELRKKAAEEAKTAKKYDSQKGFPSSADRASQFGALIAAYQGVGTAAEQAQDAQLAAFQGKHAGESDLFGSGQGPAFAGQAAQKMIDDLAEQDAALKKSQASWRSWGDSLASTLTSVVTHQQSANDAMRGILSQMLQQFIQYVIQAIAAQAGLTGAKVAGQWADKGPYGWLIGLGQAAAAMAATYAMGKAIGSAAGGWELPSSGGPFPAVLHEGEVVSHRRDSSALKRLDAMADRGELGGVGGGGGNHYHFHGPVYDARGLYRWVVDNHGQFDDAVGDLKRNGRLRNL